jgi:hypothetical protein
VPILSERLDAISKSAVQYPLRFETRRVDPTRLTTVVAGLVIKPGATVFAAGQAKLLSSYKTDWFYGYYLLD